MNRDLLQKHFQKSAFDEMQADTLAEVMTDFREEMATKQDFAVLRTELKADLSVLRAELKADMSTLRTELKADMSTLRTEFKTDLNALRAEISSELHALRTEMATLKADLTWRFVALVVFLATVVTLVDVFVD